MITGSTPCFLSGSQEQTMYGHWSQEQENFVLSSSLQQSTSQQNDHDNHSTSLLYNLSLLFDKFNQVQSHLKPFIIPGQRQTLESTPIALANMGTLIQEIITTASSMLFTCQQMSLGVTLGENINSQVQGPSQQNWYDDEYITCETSNNVQVEKIETEFSQDNYDIVELDAANLIAKYTHYCQVCGKGFKRDANLRMHMRAHGDEYKSSAALVNPMKNDIGDGLLKLARKYSCPQEGCRWNRKHAKFQPLKSIICVKNHYKRSHCPKMYLCKKCNTKRFSVLSDLRTHEKHCGDLRWQCSCGTTFSRKDKLLGHVALFVGHTPSVHSLRNI